MAYKGVLLPNEDKEIKGNIKNEETIFSWDTLIWAYYHGSCLQYLRVIIIFLPLIFGLVLCAILNYTHDVTSKEAFYINIFISIAMIFFGILIRVYVIPDVRCEFQLKNSGILVKEKNFLSKYSIFLLD